MYHPPGITLLLQKGSNPCINSKFDIIDIISLFEPKEKVLPNRFNTAVLTKNMITKAIYQPTESALNLEK